MWFKIHVESTPLSVEHCLKWALAYHLASFSWQLFWVRQTFSFSAGMPGTVGHIHSHLAVALIGFDNLGRAGEESCRIKHIEHQLLPTAWFSPWRRGFPLVLV